MRRSHHSSSASASCRLEWRPSRWLACALVLLGIGASFAAMASQLPAWAAWPASMVSLLYAAWLAWRYTRLPIRQLVIRGEGRPATLDGMVIDGLAVCWRGPLAFLSWERRGVGRGRLSWWPDTLPAAARRELRLAASQLDEARRHPRMAP